MDSSAASLSKRRIPGLPNPVVEAGQHKWLFSDEDFERTPSRNDKIEREKEDYIRHRAVEFIWQVSLMLKMPPQTSMTATVYMHRFLMRYSLMGQYPEMGSELMHPKVIAAVALFVAFKVDETMRRMKDFVIACCRVAMKQSNLIVDEQSKDYWKWRDLILQNESVMLEFLCFDLQLESPYRVLWDYTCYLGVQENRALKHSSWAFLNDSTYTILCLQFPPRVIAAAALYAAARHSKIAFPDDENGLPWWEQFDVRLDDLIRACTTIVKIYERVQQNLSKSYPEFVLSEPIPNDPTRMFDSDPTKLASEQAPKLPSLSVTGNDSASNGRKRSREPEILPSPSVQGTLSPQKQSSLNGNGAERSPKRQRTVTPSQEANLPTEHQTQLPTSRPRIPTAALPPKPQQPTPQSEPGLPKEELPDPNPVLPKDSSAEEGEVSENENALANPEQSKSQPVEDAGSEEGEI
jgi:protein BUR2